jgi:hypothetical protein
MAIELLLAPLLPQQRRSLAVAAAAPLLLLLAVATFSCSPVAGTVSSPELVELTLLAGAREKGAGILRSPHFLQSIDGMSGEAGSS